MGIDVGFKRLLDPKRYDRIWRRVYNKQTGNVKRKLANYRYTDKKAGHTVCDYKYSELLHVLSTNRCHYCGSTEKLGLDRIDNSKGHTKDNTVVACFSCNIMRGDDYTIKEMEVIKPLLDQIVEIRHKIDILLYDMRKNIDR